MTQRQRLALMTAGALALLLLEAAAVFAAPAPPSLETAAAAVLPLRGASDMGTWRCSAVVVAPGLALTAAHCVARDADYVLDVTRDVTVLKKNRILDLAALKFTAKASDVVLPMAAQNAPIGREITVIGFSLGQADLTAKFGHVARSTINEDGALVLDVAAFHGDSGGAVVNKRMELVGLLVAGRLDDAQEQIYAVPITTIAGFLEGVK